MAVLHILLPFDEAIAAVVEDKGYEIRAQAVGCFHFLAVHEEACVTGNGEHLAVRMDELG